MDIERTISCVKSILHPRYVFVFIIVVTKCLSLMGIMQMGDESHLRPFVQTVLCFRLQPETLRCCPNELIYGMLFHKQFDRSVNIYVLSKKIFPLMCHLVSLSIICKINTPLSASGILSSSPKTKTQQTVLERFEYNNKLIIIKQYCRGMLLIFEIVVFH